jgi:hypothetical protein
MAVTIILHALASTLTWRAFLWHDNGIVRKGDKYCEYSLPGFVRWCALEDFIFGILPFGISSQDNRSVDGKREFPFFPFNFNWTHFGSVTCYVQGDASTNMLASTLCSHLSQQILLVIKGPKVFNHFHRHFPARPTTGGPRPSSSRGPAGCRCA